MLAFTVTEYKARLENVRALMAAANLDAVVVTSEANFCYLTGYEAFSSYTPQAVLLTMDDDPYIILREQDVRCAEETCWLPAANQIGYDETLIGDAGRTPWHAIASFVKSKVGSSSRIGAEISSFSMDPALSVEAYRALVDVLQVQALRDVAGLVSKCKRVKSKAELAYMTEAAAIADKTMHIGMSKIAVGVRQSDVAAAVMESLASGTDIISGGPITTGPWMNVGPIPNTPHLKWKDDVYKLGDQTNLEFAGFRHRYACAIARTAYLGAPTSKLRELSNAAIESWHSAFDVMRAGVRCSEVARAFADTFGPHGFEKKSRIGYSMGIDWIDGGASLATNDQTELVPGMTFHLLAGIWNRTEGYTFSETVRVTDSGPAHSFANNVPHKLYEIDA